MQSPSSSPLDTLNLIGTMVVCILYGFSILMFIATIWLLCRGKSSKMYNFPMLGFAIALLSLSTAHVVIQGCHVYEGFIKNRDSFPGGPAGYFSDVTQKLYTARVWIYTAQVILGDSIIVYRAYIVWGTVRAVLIPLLLLIAECLTFAGAEYYSLRATPETKSILASRAATWVAAFYSTTLACNFIATALLAYRLWSIEYRARGIRVFQSFIRPFFFIVVDAGILYSATLLATLVPFAIENVGQTIGSNLTVHVVSISFYMGLFISIASTIVLTVFCAVIIRVALTRSDLRRSDSLPMSSLVFRTEQSSSQAKHNQPIPLQPFEVRTSRSTMNNSDTNATKATESDINKVYQEDM